MKSITFVVIFTNAFLLTNISSASDTDNINLRYNEIKQTNLNQEKFNPLLLNETAISNSELEDHRAQGISYSIDDININEMDLDGNFENNSNVSVDSQTGHNIVDHSAFSNTSGMATAILNSGNNVLIQNATLINISIE